MRGFFRTLFIGLSLAATPALAGEFEVHPLRLALSAAQGNGALYVRNSGKENVQVQVQIMRWKQGASGDVFEPTDAALANPPLFRVAAGATQVIRVGLTRPANDPSEIAYRVFLQEVPGNTPGQGIRTLLRLSLPVFVAGSTAPKPALHWRRTDGPAIEFENLGNVHVQVTSIDAKDAGGRTIGTDKGSFYVLPGQRARWPLKADGRAIGNAARLMLETDQGALTAEPAR